ncbi:MAG: PilT/PilU family type 4a pilus ATPase [Oligoflexia bacterium]|nr:PilT/PilU family type 4a pilus ATPase [Oligoflexia bacterium]
MTELEQKFLTLLKSALTSKASDIHITQGQAPAIRSSTGLSSFEQPPYSAEEMQAICQFMVSDPKQKAELSKYKDLDGSFEVKNLGRFRFNIYKSTSGYNCVLRVIPSKIPSLSELQLPKILEKISESPRGLVLVTGATGSGKSSTLAAMINHLNENSSIHILTVEDPVEYLHTSKKAKISQREIGRDTDSFAVALRSALRQDPDAILVGEMRDLETLDIALKASETGHLVFSTVHTNDAMKTIGRLISMFPPEEQAAARARLADNIQAIISQRLIQTHTNERVVAQEILVTNAGIAECIANEKRTSEIPSFIQKGKEVSGMQTFDQHLAELVQRKVISVETALANASNPTDFQRNLSFGGLSDIESNSSSLEQMQSTLSVESTIPEQDEPPSEDASLSADQILNSTAGSSPPPFKPPKPQTAINTAVKPATPPTTPPIPKPKVA